MRGILVALDLETTGLDASTAHIIEVGAVKFRDHEILETYSTLVDPGSAIPAKVTAITGISQSHLVGAPKIADILPRLNEFVGSAPIVGHNVEFDLKFLQKQGLFDQNESVDTYEIASVLLPTAPRYNLNALMQQLNLTPDGDYHRALADARATVQVYSALWDKLMNDLPLDLLREVVTAAQKLPWKGILAFADALAARTENAQPGDTSPHQRTPRTAAAPVYASLEPLPTRTPIDAEKLTEAFAPGGPIAATVEGYEFRAPQIEMLQAVTSAFNDDAHLLVEPAPGTGRSLAYLLPALAWSAANHERVVISVNTATLQNQLLSHDIPLVNRALGLQTSASLLKERRDYLCPRRLQTLRRRLPTSIEELRVFAKVQIWLNESDGSDSSELSLRGPAEWNTWRHLSAEDEECTLDTCESRMAGTCPFYKACRTAEGSNAIVVRHSLLLNDAVSTPSAKRVLPAYNRLIVDEAHSLEDTGTYSLSFRLDASMIKQQLADFGTNKSGLLGDVLASTKAALPDNYYERIKGFVSIITGAVKDMNHHVDSLFDALLAFLETVTNIHNGEFNVQQRVSLELRHKPAFSQVKGAWDILREFIAVIGEAMEKVSGGLTQLRGRFDIANLDDLIDGMTAAANHLKKMSSQLDAFLTGSQDNTVYWIEINSDLTVLSVHGAPLHIGPLVKRYMWDANKTVVMASPTLRTGASFQYLRQRFSADADSVRELALASPYNTTDSTLLYLPTDMPEPQDRNRYQEYIERGIIELAAAIDGRLMVLFTGSTQLRQVADRIEGRLALGNIKVLNPTDGTSRDVLLDTFRNTEKAVLLGTRAFWDDTDLPPEVLAALIIVRLPFAVPSDPVFAARNDSFDKSFDNYTVPDAILRFRQGFDRLRRIRTARGFVAVFDKRMISKSYGQTFLESLPPVTIRRSPMAEIGPAAKEWIDG